ncbi:MAG: helix-turn-helix transcriptional regulator [Clostridia bacterium]|nr:helix-turn-helix transcriptional regulator [Clostridia bacterium]
MKEYWQIIRELREDRDLKQADVAKVLKTTQQVYSRYEQGINELPLHHLITLCKFYRVSADYILGLSKEMMIR